MWECSNCSESVEDTFEVCWNCGTATDGMVDAEFRRVPDDPAVPDPGTPATKATDPDSDYRVDLRKLEATVAPHLNNGMSRREIAALICKTLALVMFAVAAVLSIGLVLMFCAIVATAGRGEFDSSMYSALPVGIVPVLAILAAAIVYWKKADWIASLMVSANPRPVTFERFDLRDATTVAFSTVGLFFLFSGIHEICTIAYIVRESSLAADEFWYNSQTWSAAIQLALAVWLIFGSRGIAAAIHWSRTAGTPLANRDAEDENSA